MNEDELYPDIAEAVRKRRKEIEETFEISTRDNKTYRSPPNKPEFQQIRERYRSAILAIKNHEGDATGTGFLVFFRGKFYAITCAHVIKDLAGEGQEITVQHFDADKVGELKAKVRWFRIRKDIKPENWTAKQDISILEVSSPFLTNLELLPLEDPQGNERDYRNRTGCWCFGYIQSRRLRGGWLEEIACKYEVSQGFVQLSLSGETKIEKGMSGAPLCDNQGNIVGMIQSIYGSQDAYLIPTKTILDVLSSLTKEQGD